MLFITPDKQHFFINYRYISSSKSGYTLKKSVYRCIVNKLIQSLRPYLRPLQKQKAPKPFIISSFGALLEVPGVLHSALTLCNLPRKRATNITGSKTISSFLGDFLSTTIFTIYLGNFPPLITVILF